MTQSYQTAVAFRRALEERLKQRSRAKGEDLNRLRRLVAFDRLLARLFAKGEQCPWRLKGGFALETRFGMEARSTKDIDLTVPRQSQDIDLSLEVIHQQLVEAAGQNAGDWFEFLIGAPSQLVGDTPEEGARLPVVVNLGGRLFIGFHVDVALGDAEFEPLEWTLGAEYLSFAGIPAARYGLIPLAQQFAEKLHAYTKPRPTMNTRVKDLLDMVFLIERKTVEPERVTQAVQLTFSRRATHAIPSALDKPPEAWIDSYAFEAGQLHLRAATLDAAYTTLSEFWTTVPFPKG